MISESQIPVITVSIASYNTRKIIRDCLQSLHDGLDCKRHIQMEVIVVDNASTDASVEMIRSEFQWVRIIENLENRGFAAAHNQAFHASSAKYFLFLNSDTIVHPGALEHLTDFMESHPNCGALGCRMIDGNGKLIGTIHPDAGYVWILGDALELKRFFPSDEFMRRTVGWLFKKHYPLYDLHEQARTVQVVDGAAVVVRREAYEKVGGLDEDFFFGSEDGQLCFDLRKSNWEVWYTPDATITHLMHQSRKQIGYRDLSYNTRNHLLLFAKQNRSVGLIKLLLTIALSARWLESLAGMVFAGLSGSVEKKAEMRSQLQAYKQVIGETIKFSYRPSN